MWQHRCPLPRPSIQAVEGTWGSLSSCESSPSCSPFSNFPALKLASNPEADDAWRLITIDVAEVGVLLQGIAVHVGVRRQIGQAAPLAGGKAFPFVAKGAGIAVRRVLLVARGS